MQIAFLRHGIAVDRMDPACPADPDRPLTARGRRRTRDALRGLRALGLAPGRVLSSPHLRARQTADLARRVVGPDEAPVLSDALLPDASAADVLSEVLALDVDSVLLVGHAPHLDRLLAVLLGADPGRPPTRLKKAGAALVERENPGAAPARLVWLLEPRALRRLGLVR